MKMEIESNETNQNKMKKSRSKLGGENKYQDNPTKKTSNHIPNLNDDKGKDNPVHAVNIRSQKGVVYDNFRNSRSN